MTAVLSPTSSPHQNQSPSPSASITHPQKRTGLQRPPSYARNRMSSYSTTSNPSQRPSRPPSQMFPIFNSSLPYASVRDFAYPSAHPLHFGPPAETSAAPSGRSTPANDAHRRLSDPPGVSWEIGKAWSPKAWGGETEQLPQMAYGEERGVTIDHGPPYAEDDDLHSPIVISARHKKSYSAIPNIAKNLAKRRGKSPSLSNGIEPPRQSSQGSERGYHKRVNGDGSETYYVPDDEGTPRSSNPMLFPNTYHSPRQAGSFASRMSQYEDAPNNDNLSVEPGQFNSDESRFSRNYQFTIVSPEEEMHGKAVALFDFARENENELPLIEGQVIWVSYRHGQGWLVAEDPKTRESGLVPEEYVRLLRDIEGGWMSLNGELADDSGCRSPEASGPDAGNVGTPTQENSTHGRSTRDSNGSNSGEKRAPVVSSFSTSSNDLNPYPHHLLSTHGQQPPQVVHYGSQTTTPTVMSPVNVDKRAAEGGQLKKTTSGQPSNAKRRKSSDVEEEEEDDDDDDSDSDSDLEER